MTLEQAARELATTPDELRLALGYASAGNIKLGARLSGWAGPVQAVRPPRAVGCEPRRTGLRAEATLRTASPQGYTQVKP